MRTRVAPLARKRNSPPNGWASQWIRMDGSVPVSGDYDANSGFTGGSMALLKIIEYPDPRLHRVAQPVAVFDDALRTLVRDMAETMYSAAGVGLAAIQVDVQKRVLVMDLSENKDTLRVFVNP